MKVRIKEGSQVFHDSWFYTWPELRYEAPVDLVFDASPLRQRLGWLNVKAPGYGTLKEYGSGSIYVRADDCEKIK